MAAPRLVVDLTIEDEDMTRLMAVGRSRTEPASRVERARTAEAKAWVVSLACQKAKDFGYPHELWTTRLLARHAREYGPAAGHECLARLVQGTVCKILDAHA